MKFVSLNCGFHAFFFKKSFHLLCQLLLFTISLAVSARSLAKSSSVTLVGDPAAEVVVYQSRPLANVPNTNKSAHLLPIGVLKGGQSLLLPPGRYVLANECSVFFFDHGVQDTRVGLSEVELIMRKDVLRANAEESKPKVQTVQVSCFDELDSKEVELANKSNKIFMLPGEHWVRVGGVKLKQSFATVGGRVPLELFPLSVLYAGSTPEASFFYLPETEEAEALPKLSQLPVGATVWLLPGVYILEINGSRRRAQVQANYRTEVYLGVLRVAMPEKFQEAARASKGSLPIFAYTNNGVLLSLNKDYLVFPGDYHVSIEGSEVAETIAVKANEKAVLKTRGAQIDPPDCPPPLGCKTPLRITVHKDQRPFALLTVPIGVPFLVLGGEYEYGVDGLRGVLRHLNASPDTVAAEKIGRLMLKWEVRQASGRIRTDLVRIEAKGQNNFGRSLDLMYHKPSEIYLPSGNYLLSYFVGDPQQERAKTKVEFTIQPGHTHALVVPLFMDKALVRDSAPSSRKIGADFPLESRKSHEGNGPVKDTPQTLLPIRK